jgi:hypothetical protein
MEFTFFQLSAPPIAVMYLFTISSADCAFADEINTIDEKAIKANFNPFRVFVFYFCY